MNEEIEFILDLAKEITLYLKPGGNLIVSGFLDINENEVIDKFKNYNLNVVSKLITVDWVALHFRQV